MKKRAIVTLWLMAISAAQGRLLAQQPQPFQFKTSVIATDASDSTANDTIIKSVVPSDPARLSLSLVRTSAAPANTGTGQLNISDFLAAADTARNATATFSSGSTTGKNLDIDLTKPGIFNFDLQFSNLRRGVSYKGRLTLSAGALKPHHWDITITTGLRGVLSVDPIPTLKIVTLPLGLCVFSACNADVAVPVTLHDKNDGGPYKRVSVRFTSSASGKSVTPILSVNSFLFFDPANRKRLDLAMSGAGDFNFDQNPKTLDLQTLLRSPGEYSGTFQFAAQDTAEDAAEARVPVVVQVRHHWSLPIAVILLGSLIGFFTSKYVAGARRAKQFESQTKELRDRANALSRRPVARDGWAFSNEGTSYGLIRVRVILHQLFKLAASPFAVLLREAEIESLRQDAARRLSSFEVLRSTRLRVQPVADRRPAVQLALGRQLRNAVNILERPVFRDAEQAEFTKALQIAEAWLSTETLQKSYREAVLTRLRSQEIPSDLDIEGLETASKVKQPLKTLRSKLPAPANITDATTVAELQQHDEVIAKLLLLWRESEKPWADAIGDAAAQGKSVQKLFDLVDEAFWLSLKAAADARKFSIVQDYVRDAQAQTYDFVEIYLRSREDTISDGRILDHPLRVRWDVLAPNAQKRVIETDSLTLVQYFSDFGVVKINATLIWKGREIPIEDGLELEVAESEKQWASVTPADWTEYAVIFVAAGFAAATGLSTIYDATFGSYGQYLTLLLWAAGAATGGNVFKQISAASTAGGNSDSTLPKPT
jgi:hypothetical protein